MAPTHNERNLLERCAGEKKEEKCKKGFWFLIPMMIFLIGDCDLFENKEEGLEPGTIRWEYKFPDGTPNIADVPALSSDGTIYATTVGDGCWLYAINSSDGTQNGLFIWILLFG